MAEFYIKEMKISGPDSRRRLLQEKDSLHRLFSCAPVLCLFSFMIRCGRRNLLPENS